MSDRRQLYGLVLAGGESRRMGEDKAGLVNRGRTQLEVVFDVVAASVEKAFVSVRASQAADGVRAAFPQLIDRYDDMGPVAGILSALEAHPDTDWLVVACDLPNVDTMTLQTLLQQAPDDAPLVAYRSANDGLPEPLCALYRASSLATIRQYVDSGIVCPRKMLIRANAFLVDLDECAALDNVNTPDDLARSVLEASQ